MKIGILTYHNARNIGAALQAYALQKSISKLGIKSEIIDYRCNHLDKVYEIKKITKLRSIKDIIKWVMMWDNPNKLKKKFDYFNNNFQQISDKVYNRETIKESHYDIYIVGSDQVWNMNLNGNDLTYILDFVSKPKRKVSYAASFGYKNVPSRFVDETKKYISCLDDISVREVSGNKIVKKLTGKEAQVVLDPTLLLESTEWVELELPRIYQKDYILLYIVASTPSALKFAKELGYKHNCDVLCIHNSYKKKSGVINIRDCSPQEFLSYIKYAKFVVSTSFHGICFSIIYNKDFFYELDEKINNNNSRIETLISMLNLWERRIRSGKVNQENNIDFNEVNLLLENQREKSINFLKGLCYK